MASYDVAGNICQTLHGGLLRQHIGALPRLSRRQALPDVARHVLDTHFQPSNLLPATSATRVLNPALLNLTASLLS